MTTSKASKPYPAEPRERAVRLVREHEAEHASLATAIRSVAAKVGCSGETLRLWVRRSQDDTGRQNIPPAEAEARYYATLEETALAA